MRPFAEEAQWLADLLEALDTSQVRFSAGAGIKPQRLNNWLSGTQRISIEGAKSVRVAYDVPTDYVICGSVSGLPSELRDAILNIRQRRNASQ
jgi:transcriptional regulator with XRE-family HTH domain